ncbi:hypothetical protein FDH34_gp394 [Serratia phage BF]|uniref:Uncharacterized protein n=1 Tax=Serratia phage BF TaxID=1962671 RepID=A0A1S6UBF6_9CAUD|nr:hypothetical protein FDH34_gp394 [Serratia phage BF]AQW89051.1 hypothetical protein BF_0526 [Serratia phage BF]
MTMKSVYAELNRYKANWKTRQDVNSSCTRILNKLTQMRSLRRKELAKASTEAEKTVVHKKYDNQIKFYDFLLYTIKLEYYEIVGKL